MSAIAQALAKAGLVEEERATSIDKERRDAQSRYQTLSEQVTQHMRKKRKLTKMREGLLKVIKEKSFNSIVNADLMHDIFLFVGIPAMNLEPKPNQNFVLGLFQSHLTEIDKTVRPLIASCRKIEREWGFKRNVPMHPRNKNAMVRKT